MSVTSMNSQAWGEYKQELKNSLNQIQIPMDANPSIVKIILSNIDQLYTHIRMEYAELEGHKERIELLIREIEREQALGKNEIDRKRNATLAVQNYPGKLGEVINLYEFQRDIIEKYSFLKGVLDSLFGKQSRLITLNGMLKLEKDTQSYNA